MKTLQALGIAELTVHRSRFIAHARPLPDDATLRTWLLAMRAAYPGASHIPYAWRGPHSEQRSSDDGEPAGTGGRQCLAALRTADVHNAAVAVARIFGGRLLGRPNLGIAYRDAATLAITQAGIDAMVAGHQVTLVVPFAMIHMVEQALAPSGTPAHREFTSNGVILRTWVGADQIAALQRRILASTSGAVVPRVDPLSWR